MVKYININDIRLDGGSLCLNFVNTVHDRTKEIQNDYLGNMDDLIIWSHLTGGIDDQVKEKLLKVNSTNQMDHFHSETIKIRELLHRIFISIIRKKTPDTKDLIGFNEILRKHSSAIELVWNGCNIEEGWNLPVDHPQRMIGPIIKDAFRLMTQGNLVRIRECPKCGWLFYDTSKNGKRKWCSMVTCGSQAKAIEWYHRQRKLAQ